LIERFPVCGRRHEVPFVHAYTLPRTLPGDPVDPGVLAGFPQDRTRGRERSAGPPGLTTAVICSRL
jgi:hypothetical protein